jgi:hypothetical protein
MPEEAAARAERSQGGSAERERGRAPRAVLAVAVAALFSSWNPLAAPIGLAVALVAAVLAWRARRNPRWDRRWAGVALAAAITAALASATVIGLSIAALLDTRPGERMVAPRTPAQARELLDAAEQRTREARDRAKRELGPAAPGKDARR